MNLNRCRKVKNILSQNTLLLSFLHTAWSISAVHLCTVKLKRVFTLTFKINQDEKDICQYQRNARRIRLLLFFNSICWRCKSIGYNCNINSQISGNKKWAYAGLFFDLAGATFSIYSSGERGANLAFMLMPILLWALSYVYYRRKQGSSQNGFNFA